MPGPFSGARRTLLVGGGLTGGALLLKGKSAGLGIDFTTPLGVGSVAVKGHTTNLNNVAVDTFLTNDGPGGAIDLSSGYLAVASGDLINFALSSIPSIQSAGTVIATLSRTGLDANDRLFQIDDGSESNRHIIINGSSNAIRFLTTATTSQADISIGSIGADTFFNTAMTWKANNINGSVNGAFGTADTTATMPTTTKFRFGVSSGGAAAATGLHVKTLVVLPEWMTDAQIAGATT